MVLHDYVVAYEGDCDPYTENCFVGCEDDECTENYYYSLVQKYAADVKAQCGTDITDCEDAYKCLPEDGDQCDVTYCNPAIDGNVCELLTEADIEFNEETEMEGGSTQDSEEEGFESEVLTEDELEVSDEQMKTKVETDELIQEEI
jgi:hypothetical protein